MLPDQEIETTRMRSFKRAYIASALILIVFSMMSVIGAIGSGFYGAGFAVGALTIILAALFPIFWKGGILEHPRASIVVASVFMLATGCMVATAFVDFVRTGGGEGPNGEGSPAANMIAIAFGAAVGFCPWLLTFLRGIRCWNRGACMGEC